MTPGSLDSICLYMNNRFKCLRVQQIAGPLEVVKQCVNGETNSRFEKSLKRKIPKFDKRQSEPLKP